MADTKQVMATIPVNMYKRIETQPEVKQYPFSSISKMIGLLLKEALDAREVNKNEKKARIK